MHFVRASKQTSFFDRYDRFLFRSCLWIIVVTPFAAAATSAQACDQVYLIENQVNLQITDFSYGLKNGQFSSNLLDKNVQPGQKSWVKVHGQQSFQFRIVLNNNNIVEAQVDDVCSAGQVIIFNKSGNYQMIVK